MHTFFYLYLYFSTIIIRSFGASGTFRVFSLEIYWKALVFMT